MIEIFESIRKIPGGDLPVVKPLETTVRKDLVKTAPTQAHFLLSGNRFLEDLSSEESINRLRVSTDVIQTPVAVSHTTRTMNHPDVQGKSIPAHLLSWMDKRNSDINLYNLHPIDYAKLSESVQNNVRYINEQTGDKPVVYQLFGYNSKESKNVFGSGRGAASNENIHIHVALPPEDSAKAGENATPIEKFKYFAPINSLLKDVSTHLAEDLLAKPQTVVIDTDKQLEVGYEDFRRPVPLREITIYRGDGKIESQDGQNNPLALEFSLKIESTKLEDYIKALYVLESRLNQVYQIMQSASVETFLADETEHVHIKAYVLEKLVSLGVSSDTADEVFEKSQLFKPTYREIELMYRIYKKHLDEGERRNEKMEAVMEKYRNNKELIQTSEFQNALKKHYGEDSAEIIISLLRDQYRARGEGDPENTLSENFSMKFVINDFEIDEKGDMIVHSATVSPLLMSAGNTIENLAGVYLRR